MRTLPIALTIFGFIVNPMIQLDLFAAESPSESTSRFPEADSDDDGLTNAEEADSGSDPTLKYSDGDGLMDGEDAVPNDGDFAFPRVPVSSYAMIDLGQDTYAMDLNNANQALLKVISGTTTSCVVWDKGQTLTVPFAFSSVLPQIADDGTVIGKTPESLSGSDNQDLFSWDPSMVTTPTKIVDVPTGTYNESDYSWRGYTAKAQYLSAAGTLFYETGTSTSQVGMTDNGWVEAGSGTINERSLNPTEERNEYTTNWHYYADGPVNDVIRETTEAGFQGTVLAVVGSGGNAKIIHKELEFLNCKFLERQAGNNYTYDYYGTVTATLKLGNQTLASNSVSYFDYNGQSLGYPEGPEPPGVSKIVNDITILPKVTGTDGTMHYEAVYAGGFLTQQARAWIDDGSSGKEKLLYHDAHRTKPIQGVASAINSRGEIILPGSMIWQNGRTFNIGTRLSGNAVTDFTVPSAKKINDSGVILAETKKIAASGTALPVNEQKNRAVLLVPVEILVPKLNAEGSDTGELADGTRRMKVAQWENAWKTTETPLGGLKDNFIDLDPDRFYVRIPLIGSGTNIKVKVSTVAAGGDPIGDWEEIEMEVDPDDAGMLKSKAQLLVADDPDKNAAGAENAEEIAKRVHKIALFGKVKIRVEIGQTTGDVELQIPTPGRYKTVHVKAVILRDQPGGTPAATEAYVWTDLVDNVKPRYAQANINISIDGVTTVDPPPGVDLSDGLAQADVNYLPAEVKTLVEKRGTSTTDDIHIFYVPAITTGVPNYPNRAARGFALVDALFPASADKPYTYNVFIGIEDANVITTAHELGHLLTNAGHPEKL